LGTAKAGQAQRRQAVVAYLRHGRHNIAEDELHFAGDRCRQARDAPAVRDMGDRSSCLLIKGRERQMSSRAIARCGCIELARLSFRELN
jgi:hypothetical protein